MASNGYVPSYKALNQNVPKQPKTLFMAPVFVKRRETDVGHKEGSFQLEPTKDKPCKTCNLPCIIPGLNATAHIPKETYTQTSKTILQLAQMEEYCDMSRLDKMAKLQEDKAERDNTLDLCPDLDMDMDMNLELDMDATADRTDFDCDDRFSMDSLNMHKQPEKENPIHSAKATRDLQECIELHDAKDLRLNQWVDNIKRMDTKQKIWGSNMTMPLIAKSNSRVSMNVATGPGGPSNNVYYNRKDTTEVGFNVPYSKSKYSLSVSTTYSLLLKHSRNTLTVHKYLKFSNAEVQLDVQNLPKSVPSIDLSKPGDKRCMTSFHNLIHLNDELLKEGRHQEDVKTIPPPSVPTKKKSLKMWHCQIEYGPSSSEESTLGKKESNNLKTQNILSKSLVDCERIFTDSNSDQTNRTRSRRARNLNKTPVVFPKCASGTMLNGPGVEALMVGNPFSNYPPLYKKPEGSSFMSPTLSSERKSLKQQVESVRWVMGNKFKRWAPTPKIDNRQTEIPFTDLKTRAVKSEELSKSASVHGIVKIPAAFSSTTLFGGSTSSYDNGFYILLNRIKSVDFNNALKSLAELLDTARHTSPEVMMPYMTLIYQRLLDLLKSPRSHVARTACQLTGHCFEVMKDTRRPEFDDIINTLLYKTADASKFIRQDANMALDAMVTHIPTLHAVRAVCAKGPTHRNPLVRCASVRLIICAIVIAGANAIMNHTCHEATRKRVLENIMHFLSDKNGDIRKYGERLFKILYKEGTFDYNAKKYLNRTKYEALMSVLKTLHKKLA